MHPAVAKKLYRPPGVTRKQAVSITKLVKDGKMKDALALLQQVHPEARNVRLLPKEE